MATSDGTGQLAKPTRHEDTRPQQKNTYEHREITDNRLVWEVLEEANE